MTPQSGEVFFENPVWYQQRLMKHVLEGLSPLMWVPVHFQKKLNLTRYFEEGLMLGVGIFWQIYKIGPAEVHDIV